MSPVRSEPQDGSNDASSAGSIHLDLTRADVVRLPEGIEELARVTKLTLNQAQLIALPRKIGQLLSLTKLSIISTQLASLPPEIGNLTNLEELWLNGNRLKFLPPEIGRLTKLRTLWLNRNLLTSLPPEIGLLANLQELELTGNLLTALPPEIGHLTNLNNLFVNRNHLAALPREIGRLNNLGQLRVEENRLTVLPAELAGILNKSLMFYSDGNPLKDPLPELIQRGQAALATYLGTLQDAIPQYEAKILLVGEGNVGKTSLVAALLNAPFVEHRPTTHGIEISPLGLPHPDRDLNILVRAWDFGGQEVYRVTHQFFFSQRALYLVVWNPREGQEQNEVEGWLRRIRLRAGTETRVLIVATHCEERRPELDYPRLEQLFPNMLAGHIHVDNSSQMGIEALRTAIAHEAVRLPQMGQLISPRWTAVRDEVLAQAQTYPQIPYKVFDETCQRNGVTGQEIQTLAELLHDLGQIIYYGDDEGLKDIIVLNPEWLTRAISYVLEDKQTQDSQGVLDHGRLKEIWQERSDNHQYPSAYHPYFLRLMEKFDVSYRLEDDANKSLVAQLVPHERQALPWDFDTPPQENLRSLSLICQFNEPVSGLIAWLTVRHHNASTEKHWRTGVFLRHPIAAYASEALLDMHTANELVVEVRAPSPDFFFNVMRDSIENLVRRRWPGVKYDLLIPCPTWVSDGTACQGRFSLRSLLAWREKGRAAYPCNECIREHDIAELLTGFASADRTIRPELARLERQVAEVASGVGRLELYAADTAQSVRSVMRMVSAEVTDCPRLFTMSMVQPSGLRRLAVGQENYRLTLWCEHPGHWHPWDEASYSFTRSAEWLAQIAPYAKLILRMLHIVIPVAASAAELLPDDKLTYARRELGWMASAVESLPEPVGDASYRGSRGSGQLTFAEGEALRGIRALVFELDPMKRLGGLRRVSVPSGEFLWVCTDHYSEYDPGLPVIPTTAARA